MQVTVEVDAAALDALLDELAGALVLPEGPHEGRGAVGAVVGAHHFADGVRGLAGVVEGDCGDEVVAHVGADDVVEEVGVDEAEIAVDGCGGAAGKVPGVVVVVGEAAVGVLEEGDGDCCGVD